MGDEGQGFRVYGKYCAACHGLLSAEHRSIYPDLLRMPPSVHAAFQKIVYDGVFKDVGMSSFAKVLSVDDVEAVHDYIISTQQKIHASAAK